MLYLMQSAVKKRYLWGVKVPSFQTYSRTTENQDAIQIRPVVSKDSDDGKDAVL